jgi:sporulation protein YhbH
MGTTAGDWSLERKGPADQARHQERVREAIRNNLEEIISDESVISSDGKVIVKVPIRTLKEYRFRFNPYRERRVGQGNGRSQVGDVLARGRSDPRAGAGPGQAGTEPGPDVYEAEVTVDELAELVFADLGLPNLQRKQQDDLMTPSRRFTAVRRTGALTAIDKRRSLVENLKRHARHGAPTVGEWSDEDLRFRSFREQSQPRAAAVVIAMRDVSGSMGEFKKYITRSFFFWMARFLRSKYDDVDIVFIAHHVEAREVDEPTFFHLGESGGTRVSSAYQLALDIVRQRYDPARWNIYPFHFSDGDNWGDSDNKKCLQLVQELLAVSSVVGYGEINEGGYTSPLWTVFSQIKDPRFIAVAIHSKRDVYPALRRFFSPATPVPAGGEPHA